MGWILDFLAEKSQKGMNGILSAPVFSSMGSTQGFVLYPYYLFSTQTCVRADINTGQSLKTQMTRLLSSCSGRVKVATVQCLMTFFIGLKSLTFY